MAQVIEESDDLVVSICGSLMAIRFMAPPNAANLERVTEHAERLVANKGTITLMVVVTLDEVPAVDHGLVVATKTFIERFSGKVLAQGVVLTGAGFSSAVLREWTAVFVDAGNWPTRSFASLEGACGWLARRPGQATELNRARKLFEALAPCMGLGMPSA